MALGVVRPQIAPSRVADQIDSTPQPYPVKLLSFCNRYYIVFYLINFSPKFSLQERDFAALNGVHGRSWSCRAVKTSVKAGSPDYVFVLVSSCGGRCGDLNDVDVGCKCRLGVSAYRL